LAKETVGYVRLEWTCPNCGAKNPGPQKLCSGCGAAQPADVKFEQAAQEEIITDEAELSRAQAGPDVHCPYCGARNPAGTKICTQCGGDLSEAAARASGEVVGAHQAGPAPDVPCPACGTLNPATALKCSKCGSSMAQPKAAAAQPVAASQVSRGPLMYIVAAVAVVLLLIAGACCVLSTRTSDVTANVESASWTRSIAVEALMPAKHQAWRDQIPSSAAMGACRQEVRSIQDNPAPNSQKVCGTPYTVDKGSGYGEVVQECKYQVYDDLCDYTVQEWQIVDTARLSGSDLNPRWPEPQLNAGQRAGERQETYQIVFDNDGKKYTYSPGDAAEFAKFPVGSRWTLKVNAFGVSDVQPAR
jgi:ribosomal protein L40E